MPLIDWEKGKRIGLFILQCVCILICFASGMTAMFFGFVALMCKEGFDKLYQLRTGDYVYTPDFLTTPPKQFIKDVLWGGEKPTTTLSDDEPVRDDLVAELGSDSDSEEEPSGSDSEDGGEQRQVD